MRAILRDELARIGAEQRSLNDRRERILQMLTLYDESDVQSRGGDVVTFTPEIARRFAEPA